MKLCVYMYIIYLVFALAYGQRHLFNSGWNVNYEGQRGPLYDNVGNVAVAVPWAVSPGLLDPHTQLQPTGGVLVKPYRPPPSHDARVSHLSEKKLHQCRRSDPNLEECILDGIKAMREKPSQEDVFMINSIFADLSMNGAKVATTLWNIVVRGGSDYRIENLKVDFKNKAMYSGELTVIYPHLYITSYYYKRGIKLGTIPITHFKTHGLFTGSIKNVSAVFQCVGSPFKIEGVEYIKLDSVTARVTIDQAQLNLQPYDKTPIGQSIANFARDFPQEALAKEAPAIDAIAVRLFQLHINESLATMPLKDILVD